MKTRVLLSAALLACGCAFEASSAGGATDATTNGGSSGTGGSGGTGGTGGGSTGPTYTKASIKDALANNLRAVELADTVVVALNARTDGSGVFYVQDGSGPGVAVFRSKSDTAALPAIGDKLTVKGRLGAYNGTMQVSNSTKYSTPLSIEVTGQGAKVVDGAGAFPTAGQPLSVDDAAAWSHTASDQHADRVGHVVHIKGASLVRTGAACTDNAQCDGGACFSGACLPPGLLSTYTDTATNTKKIRPVGFELESGVWVNNSLVYADCIKGKGEGGKDLATFPNGIVGVWDGYQDFGAGTATSPAPTAKMLYPTKCADLQ